MCPSAPRVCSEPGGQKPVLSLSLDRIVEKSRCTHSYRERVSPSWANTNGHSRNGLCTVIFRTHDVRRTLYWYFVWQISYFEWFLWPCQLLSFWQITHHAAFRGRQVWLSGIWPLGQPGSVQLAAWSRALTSLYHEVRGGTPLAFVYSPCGAYHVHGLDHGELDIDFLRTNVIYIKD